MLIPALLFTHLQTIPAPETLTHGFAIRAHVSGPGQLRRDAILSALADGTWQPPTSASNGWEEIKADAKGNFSGKELEGGWVDFQFTSNTAQKMLLDAQGDSFLFVNGTPRVGDVYGSGNANLPITVHSGNNDLLFRCLRGSLKVQITPLQKPIQLDMSDATLPDLRPDINADLPGATLVRNGTDQIISNLILECEQGHHRTFTTVPSILPMSILKSKFTIHPESGDQVTLILLQNGKQLDLQKLQLRTRKLHETYKQTFISDIDGSVQYYAVNPAWNQINAGLALSLHGAGVEAIGQADAYSSKPWVNIVCPTNRRPYGFDWEDWGRQDALEVLKIAEANLKPNPSEIYLIGHSMGGHGTILNGALYPGMFAAIAPSAGWISAETYAGVTLDPTPNPLQSILQSATLMDETRRYLPNYAAEGIYMIQGGADDNVPPTEQRSLAKLLGTFHHDFIYHEVPGQGHWWDISPEPGADCVDLAAMFDFLGRHQLPPQDSVHDIDFSTSDPEVSSNCYWATIEQQTQPLEISRIQIHVDPFLHVYRGTSQNVQRLTLNLCALAPGVVDSQKGLEVDLNSQKLTLAQIPASNQVSLENLNGVWSFTDTSTNGQKNPARTGPLRLALQHRFVLVYGTHGTAEENKWALAKARYDSELWWYRANGEVVAIPDSQFVPSKYKDQSVMLYGNSDTNSAWKSLLGTSPIQVSNGNIKLGSTSYQGDSLSAVFCYPRKDSLIASVVAISGTGLIGMHDADMLNYLQPMTSYPDFLVFNSNALKPSATDGILADGFFDNNWQLDPKSMATAAN